MALYPFTKRTFEQILADASDPTTPSDVLAAMPDAFHQTPLAWREKLPTDAFDRLRQAVFRNPSTPRSFFVSAYPRLGEETVAIVQNPAFALHVLEGLEFLGCIVEGESRQQTDQTDDAAIDRLPQPAALLQGTFEAMERAGFEHDEAPAIRRFLAYAASVEGKKTLDQVWEQDMAKAFGMEVKPWEMNWTEHVAWAYDGGDGPRTLKSFLWGLVAMLSNEASPMAPEVSYRVAATFTQYLHDQHPEVFVHTPYYPAIFG